jgi:hypothetical protein
VFEKKGVNLLSGLIVIGAQGDLGQQDDNQDSLVDLFQFEEADAIESLVSQFPYHQVYGGILATARNSKLYIPYHGIYLWFIA